MKIPLGSNSSVQIHEEGQIYILIASAITTVSAVLSGFGGVTMLLAFLTCFVISFFRNPERIVPQKKGLIVSPGDGVIVAIDDAPVPSELTSMINSDCVKVSIFLSVFNVHVNRIPVAGKIIDIKYHAGKFLNASLDKASTDNERNTIAIETENGDVVYCVQIAGLIARRIICDAEIGDLYATGDRYGIIRFGSRMDLYIPKKYKINVLVGQTMIGGETSIAELVS
jgi:phosphatidylserine decarboxylase